MGVTTFVSKNLLAIVMVPFIFGVHYTWYKLQEDDRLVSRRERERLPLYTFYRKLGGYVD